MTVASKVKQTLASMNGIAGTLRFYSNQCQIDETKEVFTEALNAVNEIITDLEDRIKIIEYEEPQYKGN